MTNTVLLDTNVVGGLLSNVKGVSEAWDTTFDHLKTILPDTKFTVPTPVWYEVAQWHPNWHKKVLQNINDGCPGLYQYAAHGISNRLLMDAAWYKCQTRSSANNPDLRSLNGRDSSKISMVDSLIATYCLNYGYYVLTLNLQDFPEKFFEIIEILCAPSTTDFQRDLVGLLKPKQAVWHNSKSQTPE